MPAAAKIFEDALALERDDRARLAARLIESLDDEADDPAIVDRAWRAEVARRVREIEDGAETVDWHEARREIIG